MNTRALVIFLGVNVVCSVAIGYKYFTKDKPTQPPVIQQQSIAIIPSAGALNTPSATQVQIQAPSFASPQVLAQSGVISTPAQVTPEAAGNSLLNPPSSNVSSITTATQLQATTNGNVGNAGTTLNPIDMAMNELRNKAIPSTPIAQTSQTAQTQATPDANASGSLVQHILSMKPEMSKNEIPSAKSLQASIANEDIKKTALNVDKIEKVCTILGPLDLKSKATMDVILSKDGNVKNSQMEVSQKPVFEIYWNLGKDREDAEVLFQKQKQNGTMQDAKFVLFQDDEKQWIVPIAEINSSEDYAKNMTTQLAITANKNNAGGKWNYRTKPNAYFYKFEDFSQIGKSTKNNIDVMLNANKAPC